MNHRVLLNLAVWSAIAVPMHAQPSQSNALGDFTMERVLTLSGVTAPAPPNLPQIILNSLAADAIEVHQVFVYNSAQRILEQTSYVLPGRSPIPSPGISGAPVNDHYIIQVDSIGISQAHGPSVAMVGHVVSNDVPTPFGDISGLEVTLAFGYQGTGPSTRFTAIMETVAPLYGAYTATGVGSLSPTASVQKCSVANLKGVYMYRLRGSIETTPNNWLTYVESGVFTADGNGTIAISGTQHFGESLSANRQSAAYVVNDDCTGSFTGKAGFAMDVVLSSDGQRVNMVFTAPGILAAMGEARMQ